MGENLLRDGRGNGSSFCESISLTIDKVPREGCHVSRESISEKSIGECSATNDVTAVTSCLRNTAIM